MRTLGFKFKDLDFFDFNCEHFLFVKQKRFADFIKNLVDLLKFWSSINFPWGHMRSHTKLGPDQFSRFDVYWVQTNKKQTEYILKNFPPPPPRGGGNDFSKNRTPLALSVPGTVSRVARANNLNPENISLSIVNWNSIIRNCYTLVQDKPNIQVLEPTESFKFYWFSFSI